MRLPAIRPAATRTPGRIARPGVRAILLPVIAIALLAIPVAALGHAQLVAVTPADGSRLEVAPAALTLTFNEPVGLGPDGIVVLDARGARVDSVPETTDGPAIVQPLPPLADGWYLVTWAIVSEDGHPVRSASVFAVGDADAAARPVPPVDVANAIAALLRGLADLGTLAATGAWAAWWLLRARRAAVRRLALAATVAGLAGVAGLIAVDVASGGAAWLGTSGPLALGGRAALLVLALLPAIARAPAAAALAALATTGSLVLVAGTGHAAGEPIGTVLLAGHLLLAATWLGAAPSVLLALRDPALADGDAIDVVRRFSRLATATIGLVLVAGAILAWRLSDGFAGGLTTWTVVLAAKVGLVLVAVVGGGLGRRHLARTPDRSRLRRLFALDAALLVAVALASGALSLGGPHGGHTGHAGGSARCAAAVGDGSVALIVTPALPGTNRIRIDGVPAGAKAVVLRLTTTAAGGATLTALPDPDGSAWVTDAAIPIGGTWDATIAVRIDTFTQATGGCTLVLGA